MKQGGNGSLGNLNVKEISKMNIPFPCLEEQQKIASFFSTLDEKISLAERKLEATENLKKGLLQKIFSREWRLSSSNGVVFPDWEKTTIGEILTIKHGKDYKGIPKGGIPVLGSGGVITRISKFLCDWPCVLIGRKGTIDKPRYMDKPFWSVDTLFFFSKPKENNDPKFQYYLFETIPWKKYNEASGVPSLSASTIESIPVFVPCFEEQKLIANLFSVVDEKISVSKSRLDLLTKLKKGFMQQMFV